MSNDGKNVKHKRRLFRIGSFLTIIFLLLYIPSFIHWLTGKTIQTEVIRMGSIEDSINIEACIARNEVVYKSPFQGIMISSLHEGERVPAGGKVADILKSSSTNLLNSLSDIDLQIITAIKNKGNKIDLFSNDLTRIDSEVSAKVDAMAKLVNENNLNGTKQLKMDIDALLRKKAEISGDYGKGDSYIEGLNSKKTDLNQQLQESTKEIISKSAGYVSFSIDGSENLLQPVNLNKLKPADIDALFNKGLITVNSNPIGDKTEVKAGEPCVKVITDYISYLVFTLGSQQANYLNEGDNIRQIRINDISMLVDGLVVSTTDGNDGRKAVVVSIDKGTEALSIYRQVNADIIKNFYEGLKVPLKSLVNYDKESNTAFLALSRNNRAVIKKVKIIACTNDSAIIDKMNSNEADGVNLYDLYVIDPMNIKEGQVIGDE